MNEEFELKTELHKLKREKDAIDNELKRERERMANLLLNSMGKDIDGVLSGKIKIKLSMSEKIKYKLKNFFNKFL